MIMSLPPDSPRVGTPRRSLWVSVLTVTCNEQEAGVPAVDTWVGLPVLERWMPRPARPDDSYPSGAVSVLNTRLCVSTRALRCSTATSCRLGRTLQWRRRGQTRGFNIRYGISGSEGRRIAPAGRNAYH